MDHSNSGKARDQKEVIIVTGSSGMIGSALIHKLAEKYDVVGFDRMAILSPRQKPNASAWTSPAMP